MVRTRYLNRPRGLRTVLRPRTAAAAVDMAALSSRFEGRHRKLGGAQS